MQGFDKVGYLKKKDHMGGFKRRWFTLNGKSLSSYKRVSATTRFSLYGDIYATIIYMYTVNSL